MEPRHRTPAGRIIVARCLRPAAHHIFGVELFDTIIGQKLQKWGIDLNGRQNGVWLPQYDYPERVASLHNGRTTKRYNDTILERLSEATSKQEALALLDKIRQELLNGDLIINGAQ